MSRKITELEELSTLGVSVVKRGANRKWFSLTKTEKKPDAPRAPGARVTKKEQIQAAVKALIAKGELPDEAAIEKICQSNGLDEKETEGIKAILRIRAAFPDSAKLDVAIDAVIASTEGGAPADPNAPQVDPNAQAQGNPNAQAQGNPNAQAQAAESAEEQEGNAEPEEDAEPEAEQTDEGETETEAEPGEKKFPPKDNKAKTDNPGEKDMTEEKKKPFAKTEGEGAEMIAKSEVEALFKSQAEAIAKAEKRASDLEAVVKAETDKRRSAEWLSKAEKELAFVPGKSTAELATMLKSAEDKDPKFAEEMFEMFKTTSAAMAKSDILRDAGTGGSAGGSSTALDKLAKIAAEKVAKADDSDLKYVSAGLRGEIKKARAMHEAMQENKPLYKEFLDQSKR